MSNFCTHALIESMKSGFIAVLNKAAAEKDTSMLVSVSASEVTSGSRANSVIARADSIFTTEFEPVEGFEATRVSIATNMSFSDCKYSALTERFAFNNNYTFITEAGGHDALKWYKRVTTGNGGEVWQLCNIKIDDVMVPNDDEMYLDENMAWLAFTAAYKNSLKNLYPFHEAVANKALDMHLSKQSKEAIERLNELSRAEDTKPVSKSRQIQRSITKALTPMLAGLSASDTKAVIQGSKVEQIGDTAFSVNVGCLFTTDFEPVEGFEATNVSVDYGFNFIEYHLNPKTGKYEWDDSDYCVAGNTATWSCEKDGQLQNCIVDKDDIIIEGEDEDIPFGSDYADNAAWVAVESALDNNQATKYQLIAALADSILHEHLEKLVLTSATTTTA